MSDYEHTQPSTFFRAWVGLWLCAFGLGTVSMVGRNAESAIVFAAVTAMLALILGLFHSLTVRVSTNSIELSFGIGLIRKRFVVDDVQTATIVRNRWYNGWGIRRFRGGWLYNVSGFDAVEIHFADGRKCRIGTDQPRELLAAIESAAATRNR